VIIVRKEGKDISEIWGFNEHVHTNFVVITIPL
jgi:hypothetical protein